MTKIIDDIGLEGEQKEAFLACLQFLTSGKSQQFFRFTAYAGCGKTYVLRKLVKFLTDNAMRVGVMALTGRAAGQLADEGVSAQTCHSILYTPQFNSKGVLIGWKDRPNKDIIDEFPHGIVVDEASMIPFNIHMRLRSIGLPIIYCGDLGQLEPVETDPALKDFNVMDAAYLKCDSVGLLENRRFDVNNGIGHIAFHLREENSIPRVKKDCLTFFHKSDVVKPVFHRNNQFDVILCGTNRMRRKINETVRMARGFDGERPEVGETVVCLRNGITLNGAKVNNGELFTVEGLIPSKNMTRYMLRSEKGAPITIDILNEAWDTEKSPMTYGEEVPLGLFGFGYCLSVHKSQGSTFNTVLYVDEDVSYFLNQRKFRYTGCTRAAKHLSIAI